MNGYGNSMNGWGYVVMGLGALVFWVLMVLVVVVIANFVIPTRAGNSTTGTFTSPDEILAARYARGDIDHEEYLDRQVALAAHRGAPGSSA